MICFIEDRQERHLPPTPAPKSGAEMLCLWSWIVAMAVIFLSIFSAPTGTLRVTYIVIGWAAVAAMAIGIWRMVTEQVNR